MKRIRKDFLEDLVINTTVTMLKDELIVHKIANAVSSVHKKEVEDSSALRNLEQMLDAALKASSNLIHCMEQGIVTEQTKGRLKELETQINQLDFDIDQEKQRTYTYLSTEMVEEFLNGLVTIEDTTDVTFRKLLVKTFIREILLYPNKVIITYHFSENGNPTKVTFEQADEIEKQSESDSAFSFTLNGINCAAGKNKTLTMGIDIFFCLDYFGITAQMEDNAL